MVFCFIKGCKSAKYKDVIEDNKKLVTFFGFPTNSDLREKWIEALNAAGHSKKYVANISKYSRICSLHFSKDCIESTDVSRLKPNSVPTIFPKASKESTPETEYAEPLDVSSMDTETIIKSVVTSEDENNQTLLKKQTPIEIETVVQCEDENDQTPKKQMSMEVETDVQYKGENGQTLSKKQTSTEIETVAQCKDEICHTPTAKQIYYIVDVNSGNITNMTPKMLVKTLNILKKSCEKKDKLINRMRVQHFRQKRKIETLEALLSAFRAKNLLPPVSPDTT